MNIKQHRNPFKRQLLLGDLSIYSVAPPSSLHSANLNQQEHGTHSAEAVRPGSLTSTHEFYDPGRRGVEGKNYLTSLDQL